jgi:hypothetical protein
MEADPGKLEQGTLNTEQYQNKARFENREVDNLSDDSSSRLGRPRTSPYSESQGSSIASANDIDVENPGPWVLHHHKPNLITEVQEPIKFRSTCDEVQHYIANGIRGLIFWIESRLGKQGEQNHPGTPEGKDSDKDWEDRRFRMSFAELQRMKLRKLQIKLVGQVVDMHRHNRENQEWETNAGGIWYESCSF